MITTTTEPAPLALFLWLSPAFPVGAFAYSHGLEWTVEAGDISDAASLTGWLEDLLAFGAPRQDAALFVRAYRAAAAAEWARLDDINQLAVALAGSLERRLETTQQGGAFVAAARAAWPCEALAALNAAEPIAYPIAVAAAAAGHALPLSLALPAYVLSGLVNLVSAAVRLSVIGQTDGQRTLATLAPQVAALAGVLLAEPEPALGGCALRSDLASLRHETQYSRLFRS